MTYNAQLKCYYNKNSLFVGAYVVDIQQYMVKKCDYCNRSPLLTPPLLEDFRLPFIKCIYLVFTDKTKQNKVNRVYMRVYACACVIPLPSLSS